MSESDLWREIDRLKKELEQFKTAQVPPKSNYVATAAPGVGDDVNDGYMVGSRWFDVTNDRAYQCIDATAGAAVWVEYGNFPSHALLFVYQFKVTAGAAFAVPAAIPQQAFNTYTYQNPGANADAAQTTFLLKAGSYTLSVLGSTGNTSGKADWKVDGVNVAVGQDWYSVALTYNVLKTAAITVSGSGLHTLSWTINGKNGGSGGYYFAWSALWLT